MHERRDWLFARAQNPKHSTYFHNLFYVNVQSEMGNLSWKNSDWLYTDEKARYTQTNTPISRQETNFIRRSSTKIRRPQVEKRPCLVATTGFSFLPLVQSIIHHVENSRPWLPLLIYPLLPLSSPNSPSARVVRCGPPQTTDSLVVCSRLLWVFHINRKQTDTLTQCPTSNSQQCFDT